MQMMMILVMIFLMTRVVVSISPATKCWQLTITTALIGILAVQHPVSTSELCHDCSVRRSLLSDSEITEIRIEYIKQQILKKLRLTEPPKVTARVSPDSIPEPLSLSPSDSKGDYKFKDDFYGKTEQIVLFPLEGGSGCNPSANNSTICFLFRLPEPELDGVSVKKAEFWLYKENYGGVSFDSAVAEDEEQLFEIAEVTTLDPNISARFIERIKVANPGWVSVDITQVVKKWVQAGQEIAGPVSEAKISVSCPTCIMGARPPVSIVANQKPFLTISLDYLVKSRRQKRNVDCAPGIEECCRENLTISFAALGWDNWIISPSVYNAYFCKGSCLPPSSVTLGNRYHSIIKKYKQQNPEKKELVSCCTAHKLSDLQVIFVDKNKNLIKALLPDMVVESCGCV